MMEEAFTMDKLKEAMELIKSVPPMPVFASSEQYPKDNFWFVEREGREYVLGHPELWAKVPAGTKQFLWGNVFSHIPIRNVDNPSEGELRGKIHFWLMTASHVPGQPPKWPKGIGVRQRGEPN